jgi:nucleoside-diphosphate-sugar epimerase
VEPFKALVDASRAKAVLGWRPQYGWAPHRRIEKRD